MKYFSLQREYKEEVVGPCPQSEVMAEYYNYDRKDSVRSLGYDDPTVPNLDAIKLVRGAHLTDLLSVVVITSGAGKVVSESLKKPSFHPNARSKANGLNSHQKV